MFGLDPQSIANRVVASGRPPNIPTLRQSVARGTIGFTLVSLGGFAPWIFGSAWARQNVGEAGMYAACAVAFIGLSGLLLHRLIIGPGSLARFYALFCPAFALYSVAWIVGWMTLRGNLGGILGLLAGAVVMGAMFANAFGNRAAMTSVIPLLFLSNLAGYYIGGWVHTAVLQSHDFTLAGIVFDRSARLLLSKTSWGLCFGLGFGPGIGASFHLCQAKTRELLGLKRAAQQEMR